MSDPGFIATGYGVAVIGIGGYILSVLRRGRRLSRRVPEGRRRWT